MHVAGVLPSHPSPVQLNVSAPGEQLAVSVEDRFERIRAGMAVRVQTGANGLVITKVFAVARVLLPSLLSATAACTSAIVPAPGCLSTHERPMDCFEQECTSLKPLYASFSPGGVCLAAPQKILTLGLCCTCNIDAWDTLSISPRQSMGFNVEICSGCNTHDRQLRA